MPEPRPLVIPLPPGKHAICQCGKTGNAPFCDGSHQGTDITPCLETIEDEGRNIAWCTCRSSGTMPYCDGSHRQFWPDPSKPPHHPEKD